MFFYYSCAGHLSSSNEIFFGSHIRTYMYIYANVFVFFKVNEPGQFLNLTVDGKFVLFIFQVHMHFSRNDFHLFLSLCF